MKVEIYTPGLPRAKATAKEIRDSAHEYVEYAEYSAQYATALTEACVALGRWPRDLDEEVWSHCRGDGKTSTLHKRLAYLRNLTKAKP